MNDHDLKLRQLLRQAMPAAPAEPSRDLWPQVLRRLDQRPVRVSAWDWAVAALLAAGCLLAPDVLPVLLYHL